MYRHNHLVSRACRFVVHMTLGIMAHAAVGEVIYETEDPFGGIFGLWGYDVCIEQSVAVRFTPDADYTFDRVSAWFMSNDFSGQTHPLVVVTLRTDDSIQGVSVPSDEILETLSFHVSAVGWNPVLEGMDSVANPLLRKGMHYWIAAESEAPCGLDGVWNIASSGTGFMSNTEGAGGDWYPGAEGAVVATIIEGLSVVIGDGDGDGDVDLFDFSDFLACVSDPNGDLLPGCEFFDFDGDGDVDHADFAGFQLAFTRGL